MAITCHLWYISRLKFEHLLKIGGNEPVFESSLLLAGAVDPNDTQRQLSRWVRGGRLCLWRRGLHALAPPFQKVKPHPFVVANHLVHGSYVSLEIALAYYDLIPDVVSIVTSVTARRPARRETPPSIDAFRHVKAAWLTAYRPLEVSPGRRRRLSRHPKRRSSTWPTCTRPPIARPTCGNCVCKIWRASI